MVDEGFDLLSTGIPQGRSSTVIGGIGLHEAGVQLVLANQEAKSIAETRLADLVAVISVRGSLALSGWCWQGGSRSPAKFLDRAEADAVGLAKGSVDSTSFGDTHLGAVDQGRDVRGIRVTEADEAARPRRFVDSRLKHPPASAGVGNFFLKSSANS